VRLILVSANAVGQDLRSSIGMKYGMRFDVGLRGGGGGRSDCMLDLGFLD